MKSFVLLVAIAASFSSLASCNCGTHQGPYQIARTTGPAAHSSSSSAHAAPSLSSVQLLQAPALSASAETSIPNKLNILLITVDALRSDMPWSGYPRPIAPNLTELERKSVSYTQAYAISSYTSMSVGGMLGGEYPASMKRDGYFFGTYPKEDLMFPERLQAAGIRTLGAQAHRYFAASAGFGQGFDVWEMVPGIKFDPQTDPNVTGPKHEAIAERILSDPKNTSGQFFAWFHFMDPHDVYVVHPEIPSWGKGGRDRYDGEVQFTDLQIGKLLKFVESQPWASRTAIIVSADHGEGFGEHGVYRHGFELFQELIRVPWFFVIPGVAPQRIAQPRSHIDLAPTIMELMGVAQGEPAMRGGSLVGELLGKHPAREKDVIVDLPRTSDNDRRRALISGKYKLIGYADDTYFRLYDLEADAKEEHDLRKTDPGAYGRMVERYRELSRGIKEVRPYACRALKGAPEGRDY
jgi:choline-sulfatase